MTRRLGLALAVSLLAGGARAEPSTPMAHLSSLQDKSFGVLLLGEGGDRDWKDSLAAMSKRFSPRFPFEFALGQADLGAIQRAVDRLAAARVKKLVVVPLYTTSDSPLMDETRFLFGVRKEPSPEFFRASGAGSGYSLVRRVQVKLPVILTQALDDHPVVTEILASRALSLSKNPADEALLLVGMAPASAPFATQDMRPAAAAPAGAAGQYLQTLAALAERIRAKGGFKLAGSAALSDTLRQSERQRSEDGLQKLCRDLSRSQRVIVVLHAATGELASRRVLRALQGTFMRLNQKGLLPDERIAAWIEESARAGAALPDMRVYKDDGRALPSERKPLGVRTGGGWR